MIPRILPVLVILSSTPAMADQRLEDQLTQYAVIVADMERSASTDDANAEIARFKSWLTAAQARLANDDEDGVETMIRRLQPQVRLVRAMLSRVQASARLASMKEEAESLRDEAARLRLRTKELDQRRKDLQSAVDARQRNDSGLLRPQFGGSEKP